MTLEEYMQLQGFQPIFNQETGEMEFRGGGSAEELGYDPLQEALSQFNPNAQLGALSALDPNARANQDASADLQRQLEQMLRGTAGYVAPATASELGIGGQQQQLLSLEDFYNYQQQRAAADATTENFRPTVGTYQADPAAEAARAAFEAKYPGYYQISPSEAKLVNGQVQFNTAGPSVGEYIADPSQVVYDPEYGYINKIGNAGRAGAEGGNQYKTLAAMVALAGGLGYAGVNGLFGAGATGGGAAPVGATGAGATGSGGFSLAGGTAGNVGGLGLSSTGGLGLGAAGQTAGLGLAPAGISAAGGSALLTPAITGGATGLASVGGLGGALSPANLPTSLPSTGGGGASTAATSGSAISRILDGSATAADWTQVLGGVGSSVLGAAGANAQGDAYRDVADKYLALGSPYRDLLQQSYQPGFSIANQPDFQNALDIGAQAAARATSARVGNPVDNPGAFAEMQKYISGSLALPQLNTYRSQLGSFGQLGTNVAGTNDTQAAGQTSGLYNSLGSGLASLTRPQNQYDDLFKSFLSGQNLKLNSGSFF